jgi:hypothetical protein
MGMTRSSVRTWADEVEVFGWRLKKLRGASTLLFAGAHLKPKKACSPEF